MNSSNSSLQAQQGILSNTPTENPNIENVNRRNKISGIGLTIIILDIIWLATKLCFIWFEYYAEIKSIPLCKSLGLEECAIDLQPYIMWILTVLLSFILYLLPAIYLMRAKNREKLIYKTMQVIGIVIVIILLFGALELPYFILGWSLYGKSLSTP